MEKVLNTDDWNMPAERGRFKKISEEKNRMGEAVKKAGVSAAAAAAAALQNRAQTPIQKPRAEGGTLLKKDETSDNDQSSG